MSRAVISPIPPASPLDQTIEVLERRLAEVEEDTKCLSDQLSFLGGDLRSSEISQDTTSSFEKPVSPFRATFTDVSLLHKNYDVLALKLCKAESTVQTLKHAVLTLHNDDELRKRHEEEINVKISDVTRQYESEINILREELNFLQTEIVQEAEAKEKARRDIKQLQSVLQDASRGRADASVKAEESELAKQKLLLTIEELQQELLKERNLRESFEESHSSLLKQVQDMETIVNSEKNEVKSLTSSCDLLRQDASGTYKQLKEEQRLRLKNEKSFGQLVTNNDKLQKLYEKSEDSNKILLNDLDQIRGHYAELIEQLEEKQKIIESQQVEIKKMSEKVVLEDEVAMLRNRLKKIEEENKDLEECLMKANKEVLNVKNRYSSKEQEFGKSLTDFESKTKALREQVSGLQKEKIASLNEKENLTKELEESGIRKNKHLFLENEYHQLSLELKTLTGTVTQLEQENATYLDRIAELEENQASRNQVDSVIQDMLEQKKKLAYEKGRLQSHVEQLQSELESSASNNKNIAQLQKFNKALEYKYAKSQKEISELKIINQRMEKQVHQLKDSGERKERDFTLALESRNKALKELDGMAAQVMDKKTREQQKLDTLQKKVDNAKADNEKMAQTLEAVLNSYSKLQQNLESLQTDLGRKDNQILQLKESKLHAQDKMKELQKELEMLQNKLVHMETVQIEQLNSLRETINQTQQDKKKMASALEHMATTNSKLQHTIANLTDELDRKSYYLDKHKEAREKENEQRKKEIKVYEEQLENLRHQIKKENSMKRNNKDIAELKKTIESLTGRNGELSRTNTELRHKLLETECTNNELREKLSGQKHKMNYLYKTKKQLEEDVEKIKSIKIDVDELEKVRNEYMKKNQDQGSAISELMKQISSLQTELHSLAKSEFVTSARFSNKDEAILKENDMLRRKYKDSKKREEALRKYADDNFYDKSNQLSLNLGKAQHWFHSKFNQLQDELKNSRKVQDKLEDENKLQHKMLEDEQQRTKEVMCQAREMLKTSQVSLEPFSGYADRSGVKELCEQP